MIKAEFVSSRRFDSLYQLQLELADYVHWFNNIRLHGTLGYLSPAEFKKTCSLQFLSDLGLTIHIHWATYKRTNPLQPKGLLRR